MAESSSTTSAHYIEFRNVSKAFGDKVVLDDVSFQVDPGETVCILGRSGVGKSVTLGHIMGFLKPDQGRIFVAHTDITDFSEPQLLEIHRKVTMVSSRGPCSIPCRSAITSVSRWKAARN